jgi:hypothetical protein
MPTAKYNWTEIKQKYFDSSIEEVENFLRTFLELDPLKPLSSDKKTKAKGWRAEKLEYRRKIATVSEQKVINNTDVISRVNNLIKALENTESKVAFLIGGKDSFGIDDLPKIKVGYEILRLATGRSTANVGGDKENPQRSEIIITTNLTNIPKNE